MAKTLLTLLTALLIGACAQTPKTASSAERLNLSDPNDSMLAFVKMRGSLDPEEETVFWWYGTLFAQVPGSQPQPLMRFEGYNVSRQVPQDDGSFEHLTREVTYYQDLKTGDIMETWENPFTGQTNTIMQVHNDPVNGKFGPRDFGWIETGDKLQLLVNVPLRYPNALQPDEWPEESTGEWYLASEHFGFFADREAILDPNVKSAPAQNSWFRTGPWLPWMKMGQRPGGLIYSGSGRKLMGGIGELPKSVYDYTQANFPTYLTAPTSFERPNETSWNKYKKLMEAKRQSR